MSFCQLIALQRNGFFDHKTRCRHVTPDARKSHIALLYFLRFCIPLQHPGTFFFSIVIYYLINRPVFRSFLSLHRIPLIISALIADLISSRLGTDLFRQLASFRTADVLVLCMIRDRQRITDLIGRQLHFFVDDSRCRIFHRL